MKAPLSPDRLRRSYDETNLRLKTTADLDAGMKIIILTGRPANEVHEAAKASLRTLAETLESFRASAAE